MATGDGQCARAGAGEGHGRRGRHISGIIGSADIQRAAGCTQRQRQGLAGDRSKCEGSTIEGQARGASDSIDAIDVEDPAVDHSLAGVGVGRRPQAHCASGAHDSQAKVVCTRSTNDVVDCDRPVGLRGVLVDDQLACGWRDDVAAADRLIKTAAGGH